MVEPRQINVRLFFCLVAAAVPLLVSGAGARAQDLCAGLVQDRAAHPMTALAKPALGQTVIDPEFGTTIRRITAVPVSGSDPVIKPMYSTISAWNADESRLILYDVNSGHQLYDGRTYAFISNLDISPADTEQVYWHTSDPDLLYYVDNKTLIRYHVGTRTKDQVRTFDFCSTYVTGGSDPMFMSWDSNRIGLECGSQTFIYDIPTNTVTGLANDPNHRAPQVAPSGTLALWDGKVADAQLNVLRTLDLANPYEHASLGRYSNGHDTYNASIYDEGPDGSGVGALVTHDMTDGTSKVVIGPATGYPYPTSVHVSALAYKQPGWVAVSVIEEVSGQNLLDNELLFADTNTGKVCRIGHHRSYGKNNTHLATPYWAEPHAVPSPSGTRVLFGSDWGNGPSVDTYVVELSPMLSISDAVETEGDTGSQNMTFTVTLSIPSTAPVTVNWATANGSATAGADYAMASGALSFPPGVTSQSVAVTVFGDLLFEADETLFVNLSGASGAVIADAQGVGTITDDDPPPSIAIQDVLVSEGDSGTTSATFNLSLSAPGGLTVTVAYATADGTASAGEDYVGVVGVVSFPPGATVATVAVSVKGDWVYEPDESLTVNLSNPVNVTIADAQAVGTILNDDSPGLSIADIAIVEPSAGTRTAAFTVTLSPASAEAVTVEYETADGTASVGSDYHSASGALSFPPGTASQPISVTVDADSLVEGGETFFVNLRNASGAPIAHSQATGFIFDPGNFFTLVPCRILDTRNPSGPFGGPSLIAGQTRIFSLAGRCGIPASVRAVSVNVTVTQPTTAGYLRMFAAGGPVPLASSVNYSAGQTRANNAVVGLNATVQLAIGCGQVSGTTHVILDVSGYFE